MKIAITSDIHLQSYSSTPERFNALEDILKKLKQRRISYLIIAGDLFDKDYKNYSDFDNLCKKYSEINILAIPGNHDTNIKNEFFSSTNITIITKTPQIFEIDNLKILFIPYSSEKSMDEAIVEFSENLPIPEKYILIGHGDYISTYKIFNPYEKGLYMPISANAINKFNPLKVILGHIHKPFKAGRVIYPGSPCGIDITETGKRKFLLFDTYDLSFEEIEVNTDVIYFIETVNIYPVDNDKRILKQKLEEIIKNWEINEDELKKVKLRLILKGYTNNIKETLKFIENFMLEKNINFNKENVITSDLNVISSINEERIELFEKAKEKLKKYSLLCSKELIIKKIMDIIFSE